MHGILRSPIKLPTETCSDIRSPPGENHSVCSRTRPCPALHKSLGLSLTRNIRLGDCFVEVTLFLATQWQERICHSQFAVCV